MPDRIAFLDFEASGLSAGSWPVEIGWGFTDGEPVSYLIRPAATWSEDVWRDEAEALHGLTQVFLHQNGADAEHICAIVNDALAGFDVYSDAPDWDSYWLLRLFEAGGMKATFNLRDFGALLSPLEGNRRDALLARATEIAPHKHRAADDVRHMQALYCLAVGNK